MPLVCCTHTHTRTHTHIYAHTHIRTHAHTHMLTHTYAHTRACKHTHKLIHTYAKAHKHTHATMHTQDIQHMLQLSKTCICSTCCCQHLGVSVQPHCVFQTIYAEYIGIKMQRGGLSTVQKCSYWCIHEATTHTPPHKFGPSLA